MSEEEKKEEECEPGKCRNVEGVGKIDEIKTIDIFLTKPIVGSLAIALMIYFFAALLFKIKGTPLEASNYRDKRIGKYIYCGAIDLDKYLFQRGIECGSAHENAYKQNMKNTYGKIFWPWLAEYLYPPKPNRTGGGKKGGAGAQKGGDGEKSGEKKAGEKKSGKTCGGSGYLDFMYLLMLPFFLTLQKTTYVYYKIFSMIKKMFYKEKHWGSLSEINKINKKLWLTDFIVVFFCIPVLLFFIMPVVFVGIFLMQGIFMPFKSLSFHVNKSDDIRDPNGSQGKKILKIIGWFFLYMLTSPLFCCVIFILHMLWFFFIMTGAQESEADGLKTIIKTWANIIWDYKFILAILAGTLWLNNFKRYLYGTEAENLGVNQESGILSFIKRENQEMIVGTTGGALMILLLLQQKKYFSGLSKDVPKPRNCGQCEAPKTNPNDLKKKGEKPCLNPNYDENFNDGSLSFKYRQGKKAIGKSMRKAFNAEKADSVVAAEKKEKDKQIAMAKQREKSETT